MNHDLLQQFVAMWKGDEERHKREYVEIGAARGHHIYTDKLCLWGFPVNRRDIINGKRPVEITRHKAPDAWFVWACAGDIRSIPDVIPYRLPHIIFARDNEELRVYDYDRLIGKIKSRSHEKLTQFNS